MSLLYFRRIYNICHNYTKMMSQWHKIDVRNTPKMRQIDMILVVGGIKGGSGKTTIATNLAVMRSCSEGRVLLIDADEQKSATQWSSQREEKVTPTEFPTIELSGKNLH